jgi:hypothetical protein
MMSKNSAGSLGYQMMKALQGIFQPGASRHTAKRRHRDAELITGISTMRCMSADVHQFARFIRINWPDVKHLSEVRQEMALAYIEELEARERSGGRIARVCASLRKLDTACRKAGIFPPDAPPLLPYKESGRTRRLPFETEAHPLHRRASPGDHRAYRPAGSHCCQAAHADVGEVGCALAKLSICALRISTW